MSNSLETLLRQHDPATGTVLTSFDRARTLRAANGRRRIAPRLRVALAMALLLVLIAGAFVIRSHRREEALRQVQYATPGGTRIVWTLDPKFRM
jgi:hypothetical protein